MNVRIFGARVLKDFFYQFDNDLNKKIKRRPEIWRHCGHQEGTPKTRQFPYKNVVSYGFHESPEVYPKLSFKLLSVIKLSGITLVAPLPLINYTLRNHNGQKAQETKTFVLIILKNTFKIFIFFFIFILLNILFKYPRFFFAKKYVQVEHKHMNNSCFCSSLNSWKVACCVSSYC